MSGRWVRRLGGLLGWLAGTVLRIRRGEVERALARAGVGEPASIARAMYGAFGASLVEFLVLVLRGKPALKGVRIEEASRVRWEAALAEGRGVVVGASHTGNWDLAACAVAQEVELLVVTKHLSVAWMDRIWQNTRGRMGVKLADAGDALTKARRVLDRGGAVVMMIDQVPISPRHASSIDFLGRLAATDRAPAALAAARRIPFVVTAARRDANGEHVIHVLDVLRPPDRPTRAWVLDATRKASALLGDFVLAYPDQWLWLHRRWKSMLQAPWQQRDRPTIRSSSKDAASQVASS